MPKVKGMGGWEGGENVEKQKGQGPTGTIRTSIFALWEMESCWSLLSREGQDPSGCFVENRMEEQRDQSGNCSTDIGKR